MEHRSNYHQLAAGVFRQHTGTDLDAWLVERRPVVSLRRMAAELAYLTDGQVAPAIQTLDAWHQAAAQRGTVAA